MALYKLLILLEKNYSNAEKLPKIFTFGFSPSFWVGKIRKTPVGLLD